MSVNQILYVTVNWVILKYFKTIISAIIFFLSISTSANNLSNTDNATTPQPVDHIQNPDARIKVDNSDLDKVNNESAIRLRFPDDQPLLTNIDEINEVLGEVGTKIWPLDLSNTPADIKALLSKPTLTEDEVEKVKSEFLLTREELLEIIRDSGREPHVPGGGELITSVLPQGNT